MGVEIEGTFIKDQNSFWDQSNDDLLEFLKEDLKKSRWDKAIIEGVPEDKVLILQNWIKKKKGKIEGIEVSIKPTLTGLTIEEEETFELKYRAELACNRVQLCKNEIYKFQRYNESDCPEEWKPQRLGKKIKWWKQKLIKAKEQDKKNANRLHRENEASKENVKTAKKFKDAQIILEKHSHIGKGPRKHNITLNDYIDDFDKKFSKNRKKEPTAESIAINFKKRLENHSTKPSFIINVEDENDNCIKWRDDKGNIKYSEWGEAMRARITRIRKKRNKQ